MDSCVSRSQLCQTVSVSRECLMQLNIKSCEMERVDLVLLAIPTSV